MTTVKVRARDARRPNNSLRWGKWILAPALLLSCTTNEPQGPLPDSGMPAADVNVPLQDAGKYSVKQLVGEKIRYDVTQWPVDAEISANGFFGPRKKVSEDSRYDFHKGIDIPVSTGQEIHAAADGEIHQTYSEDNTSSPYPSGGNVVVIRHQLDHPFLLRGKEHGEYFSLYMHLDSIAVEPGEEVAIGKIIGAGGHSGDATTDHLHFEIRVGNVCSREYQLSNPDLCSDFGSVDPHVNPLLFLEYNDSEIEVEIPQESPLKVIVRSNEPDFNRIFVGYGSGHNTVDFNERLGIDLENMDNSYYDSVTISPAALGPDGYEITFEFERINGFESIEVKDIWGNGLRIKPI